MSSIHFFENNRRVDLHSFRSLCNAMKALAIEVAIKSSKKCLVTICDIGCGKGGDIGKFMSHRPKLIIGIDGSQKNILEALKNLKFELLD